MAGNFQHFPSPNSKYQFVGPNYKKHGEVAGYVYWPYDDKYYVDPQAAKDQMIRSGTYKEEKKPGMFSTLAPVVGGLGAVEVGKSLGKEVVPAAKDALGLGEVANNAGGGSGMMGAGQAAAEAGTSAGSAALPSAISAGANGTMTIAAGAPIPEGMVAVGTDISGATMVAPAASQAGGMFSVGGIGSAGNAILPVAGAALAGDVLLNKRHGVSGAAEGAASGAMIGSYFGPTGAVVGGLIGAGIGFFGNFGDVDAYKTEWKRKKKLVDQGIITADQLGPEPKKGRSKEELVAEARANGGNITFASSRNEADLTPTDIVGYASVIEEAHKRGIPPMEMATLAIQNKAVREHHGTVDLIPEKLAPAPAQNSSAGQPASPIESAKKSTVPYQRGNR